MIQTSGLSPIPDIPCIALTYLNRIAAAAFGLKKFMMSLNFKAKTIAESRADLNTEADPAFLIRLIFSYAFRIKTYFLIPPFADWRSHWLIGERLRKSNLRIFSSQAHAGASAMSLFKGQEVLAFARMTMHLFNNGGDPDFRQDRNP